VFYPLSELQVYRDLNLFKEGGKPIKFPSEIGISYNYFHKNNWSAFGLRRIKNVIMILEWIPSLEDIQLSSLNSSDSGIVSSLDNVQMAHLKRSFDLVDIDRNSLVDKDEALQLRELLDLNMESIETFNGKLRELNLTDDNLLDFNRFKEILSTHNLHQVHKNRYYIAISLEEAQSLRALMHCKNGKDLCILSGSSCSIALRSEDYILDVSKEFVSAPGYQRVSSLQCFRFFNSDTTFTEAEISILIRSLQLNSPLKREIFWKEIRSCRRRPQTEVSLKPIQKVFNVKDEWELLGFRSMLVSAKLLMYCRDMRAFDAFRAFDKNRDGILSCSELYTGLDWLGMRLLPDDVYALVKSIDKSGEGRVYLEDFLSVFYVNYLPDEEKSSVEVVLDRLKDRIQACLPVVSVSELKPKLIKELFDDEKSVKKDVVTSMDDSVLKRLRVSCRGVKSWRSEWSSKQSNSRKEVSVWSADLSGKLKRNQILVSLGHYAVSGLGTGKSKPKPPVSLQGSLLCLTDEQTSAFFKSRNLSLGHIEYLLPVPSRYRRVWAQQSVAGQPLFVWRGVPPSDDFIALGMVCTNTEDPPQTDALRCVPKQWTRVSQLVPEKIWDDAGSGGQKGSFWTVNSLNLLWATEGHDMPSGPFYELIPDGFFALDRNAIKPKKKLSRGDSFSSYGSPVQFEGRVGVEEKDSDDEHSK
jgi:Ca2+-binding EF-hand superfamily protein